MFDLLKLSVSFLSGETSLPIINSSGYFMTVSLLLVMQKIICQVVLMLSL